MNFDIILDSVMTGFPFLFLHFMLTVGIWLVAVWVYAISTPYAEMKLIRENNVAAAVTLGGAMLGLAIPLAFAMASSVSMADILIWGLISMTLQILVYRVINLVMKNLPHRIEAGEIAPAILVSATMLSIGAFNAAAVSG
ncbi:MAG: DUF350 domain-containing protein [Alphaproteobacteria bacterium]|nr:DUF350 domain-containing protein [Alphaproteobacteria bacterium]